MIVKPHPLQGSQPLQARRLLRQRRWRPRHHRRRRSAGARAGTTISTPSASPTAPASSSSCPSPAGRASAARTACANGRSRPSPGPPASLPSTERIGLFMTVHVPIVHPLYAAKALATVDHISKGRAGLNIVCGWNPQEFAMFGVALGEKGYVPGGRVGRHHRARLFVERAVRLQGRVLRAQGRRQPPREPAGAAPGHHERRLRRARPRLRGEELRLPVLHLHRHRGRPPPRRRHPGARSQRAPRGRHLHGLPRRLPRDAAGGRGLLPPLRRGRGRPRRRRRPHGRQEASSPTPTTRTPTTAIASASPAARAAIRWSERPRRSSRTWSASPTRAMPARR